MRGFRTAGGTLIALAVLLCAWPSQAKAGCSHYVVAKTHAVQLTQLLDSFERLDESRLSTEAPARPQPCSGAFCSGKPAVPVPVPIPMSRHTETVAPLKLLTFTPLATIQFLAYTERIVHAEIEGPSIDRPPR